MTNRLAMNRRSFVTTVAVLGGGMAISVRSAIAADELSPKPWLTALTLDASEVNAWVMIQPDNTVVFRFHRAEMGQGAVTSMPLILCEELECDWSKVKVEFAEAHRNVTQNRIYGEMRSVGSQGIRTQREPLQKAGAEARERLKQAAATEWKVPVTEVEAKNSMLRHAASNRTMTFGQIASKAALVKLDKEPAIKTPDQFNLIGKGTVKRFDTPLKVNGSAVFAADIRIPGMVYAAVKASPAHRGKLKSFDANALKDRPGIIAVVALGKDDRAKRPEDRSRLREAVAVVADTWWNAKTALDIMPVEWDDSEVAKFDTESIYKTALDALDKPGVKEVRKVGDAAAAMRTAAKTVSAKYLVPYLDHATMEPLAATVHLQQDRVDVWAGSQDAENALRVAAEELAIAPAKVYFHETFLGGGFGRRSIGDEVRQAVAIARLAKLDRPVHLQWTREETTRQGIYRPMHAAKFEVGLGADGKPVAWMARVASDALNARANPVAFQQTGIDYPGNLSTPPYAVPTVLADYTYTPSNLHLGHWRAPSGWSVQVLEGFMDEVAEAAGKDPVAYRRELLVGNRDPGYLKCLDEVVKMSGWGTKTYPKGTAQGFAIGEAAGTICANVVTLSVAQDGSVKLLKVDTAFDSGNIINRADIEAQVQGQVVMGYTATMYGELNVRRGRIVEGNFDDYQMMRIDEMPDTAISFGALTGGSKWGGIGEASIPMIPPAVTNAVARATGKRIRTLPLKNHDLSWS